jgi:hypothetical protein
MRFLALPPAMIQDLQRGAPGLRDAVAQSLRMREDPEVEVYRRPQEKGGALWVVVVHSRSTREEVELNPKISSALGPAIVLHLFTLADELRRDHPVVVHNVDLAGMMVQLLLKVREWSS